MRRSYVLFRKQLCFVSSPPFPVPGPLRVCHCVSMLCSEYNRRETHNEVVLNTGVVAATSSQLPDCRSSGICEHQYK